MKGADNLEQKILRKIHSTGKNTNGNQWRIRTNYVIEMSHKSNILDTKN